MSLNKVLLIGFLGQDPELKYTNTNRPLARFSIATSQRWTNEDGLQEKTEWHRIVVWGRQAETCAQYLAKGRQVYVEGSLQTRSYDDADGVTRKITEVVAYQVQFLGKSDGTTVESAADTGSAELNGHDDVPF